MSQGVGSAFTAGWISIRDTEDLTSRDLWWPAMHSRSLTERPSIAGKRCLGDWLASTLDSTTSTTSKRRSRSRARKKPGLLLFLALCSLASGSPLRDPASPSLPLLLADAAPSTSSASWRLKRSAPAERSNSAMRIYVTSFPSRGSKLEARQEHEAEDPTRTTQTTFTPSTEYTTVTVGCCGGASDGDQGNIETETTTVFSSSFRDKEGDAPATVTETVTVTETQSEEATSPAENNSTTTTTATPETTETAGSEDGNGNDDADNDDQQEETGSEKGCQPGEAGEEVPGGSTLTPTGPQETTFYVIAGFFVFDLIGWHLIFVRDLIFPAKVCVVMWHELGHVVALVLAGRYIDQFFIDPHDGGATLPNQTSVFNKKKENPEDNFVYEYPMGYPVMALIWGPIFSIIIGGVLTFCGFNTFASKIASFFIGSSLLVTLWFAAGVMTRIVILAAMGLLIGFWFIEQAAYLRFFVLFFGVMSSFYMLWDVIDDYIFRKRFLSCPALHAVNVERISAATFTFLYLAISVVVFILWIFLAVAVWRQTDRAMFCQSQQWLPA